MLICWIAHTNTSP